MTGSNTPGKVHSPAAREKILTKQGQTPLSFDEKCHLFYCCSWSWYPPHCGKAACRFFLHKNSDIWSEICLEPRLGICIRLLVNIILQRLNGAEAPVWRLQPSAATSSVLKKQENTQILPPTTHFITKALFLWFEPRHLCSSQILLCYCLQV